MNKAASQPDILFPHITHRNFPSSNPSQESQQPFRITIVAIAVIESGKKNLGVDHLRRCEFLPRNSVRVLLPDAPAFPRLRRSLYLDPVDCMLLFWLLSSV